MSHGLDALRDSLLTGRPRALGPEEGVEAFERHQLLAIRFHRAAKVNNAGGPKGEGAEWRRFFGEHFPRGGEHAQRLWVNWRVTLLKEETPGVGVAITHGRPDAHWQISDRGLVVDLESMWDDYATSVQHLIETLRGDSAKCARALEWWKSRLWTVQEVVFSRTTLVTRSVTSASVGGAPTSLIVGPPTAVATAMTPPPVDES